MPTQRLPEAERKRLKRQKVWNKSERPHVLIGLAVILLIGIVLVAAFLMMIAGDRSGVPPILP